MSSPPSTGNQHTAEMIGCATFSAGIISIILTSSATAQPPAASRILLLSLLGLSALVGGLVLYSRFRQDSVRAGKILATILIFVGLYSVYTGVQPLLPPAFGGASLGAQSEKTPPAAQLAAGVALFRQGQYAQAIEKLKEAAQGNNERFEANRYLGECYLMLQNNSAAKDALLAAYNIREDEDVKRFLGEAYYNSGVECLNRHDRQGAVAELGGVQKYNGALAEKLADLINQHR